MENILRIKGARQHNLKDVSIDLPKNKLIVFTGISGSGKSSLAFDTIYAEGQRRYVESLSSYARQFLGIMDKPDVDSIEGLSPAISIDQKSRSHNPRSTVGTVTEIYDYLRLLFARIGHPHCPNCGREISRQSSAQIVHSIFQEAKSIASTSGMKQIRFFLMAPVVRDRKGEFIGLFDNLRAKGFSWVRVDGRVFSLDEDVVLIKTNKHTIDVVIDKVTIDTKLIKQYTDTVGNDKSKSDVMLATLRSRVNDAVEQALSLSDGLVVMGLVQDAEFSMPDRPKSFDDHLFSELFSCPVCNISLPEIEPRSFSFNSPHGACETCSGIGTVLTIDPTLIISPDLSFTEGGILPFAKMFYHDTWYSRVVKTVAEKYDVNVRRPISEANEIGLNMLLYGTGKEMHHVPGTNRQGEMTSIQEEFPGFIPELKRRFVESESDYVRSEIEKYMRRETCKDCDGKRLRKESLTITIKKQSISDIADLSIKDAKTWARTIGSNKNNVLSDQEFTIATPIVKEISARLSFLVSVGLDYLTLSRSATTLAGGEAQRIRLASQIGSGLSGVLYVLDEPSIGLHQRDNRRLISTLKQLRDLGNTVIVVEHDREMIEEADYVVDIGPGAGEHGGAVVASGDVKSLRKNKKSVTAQFLSEKRMITRPENMKEENVANLLHDETLPSTLTLKGASENNLKHTDITIPLGKFVCVTGVSGSGKSTLVVETLYQAVYNHFADSTKEKPGSFDTIEGLDAIRKVILIDQSPIGRTPRSNPATYTGIFNYIRDIFSEMSEAKLRGYKPGRFSFNVKGGRCEACEGDGQKKIEMQFLSDIYVTCEVCHGARYNHETLEVRFRGKSISDVLHMTVSDALEFFSHHPAVSRKLQTMVDVGLGYLKLGQPAPTLSGGEAQRIKLATELSKRVSGDSLYILDEPTTGLHFADLEKLLHVLHRLTAKGNTVLVIEHNLDIIKNADWIIDLGPEGGENGGEVIATGTPREITKISHSHTGKFLKEIIG